MNTPFEAGAFADAVPFGAVLDSVLDDDGRFDLDRLVALAQTDVVDFGLLVDAHVAVSDHPNLPTAPFEEFPRLAAMTPIRRDAALLIAVRTLVVHEVDVPVTIDKLPEVSPQGVPPVVAEARAAAVGLGLLECRACQERYVVSACPRSARANRMGPLSRAADQARRFVNARGPVTATTWRRGTGAWLPEAEEDEADQDTAARVIRDLGGR